MGIICSAGIPNFKWSSSKIHCLLVGKTGIDCKLYLIFNINIFISSYLYKLLTFLSHFTLLQDFKKKVAAEVAKLWTAEAHISREVQGEESEHFKKLFKS